MSLREELVRRFPLLERLPPPAWVVGGAVRDLLRGAEPLDVDVACADPRACAAVAGSKVIRLGTIEHLSAWRVTSGGNVYDFAELLDGDIGADLARRDFTVDAIAVDLASGEMLDPHHGRDDLRDGIVRMIAEENFDDDPLRCLKAVRVAVRFDFAIDEATIAAIRARAASITSVAAERVTYELGLIFGARRLRKAFELLNRCCLDHALFGRKAPSVAADDVSPAGSYALAVAEPREYAKRWKWSRELLQEVEWLKRLLTMDCDVRIALYDAGEAVARQLPPLLRALGRDDDVEMPDFSLSALLSGEEIAKIAGLCPGPHLGSLKRALLEAQIRGEVRTKEEAIRFTSARA